jgi:hypothetical protein
MVKQNKIRKTKPKRKTKTKVRRAPASKSYPKVNRRNPLRSLRFSNKEILSGVYGGSALDAFTAIRVNPGDHEAFPWLAQVAGGFEKYRFHSFSVEYLPNVSSTTNGRITIVPDYDPSDNNSTLDRRSLFSFEGASTGSVWDRCLMVCSKKHLKTQKSWFMRSSFDTLPTGQDLKFYDQLQINVVVSGTGDLEDPTLIGDLIVHYDIEFFNPQLHDWRPTGATEYLFNPTARDRPFSDLQTKIDAGLDLGVVLDEIVPTDPTFSFTKAGKYLLNLAATGSQFTTYSGPTLDHGTLTQLDQAVATDTYVGSFLLDILDSDIVAGAGSVILDWAGLGGSAIIDTVKSLITAQPKSLEFIE